MSFSLVSKNVPFAQPQPAFGPNVLSPVPEHHIFAPKPAASQGFINDFIPAPAAFAPAHAPFVPVPPPLIFNFNNYKHIPELTGRANWGVWCKVIDNVHDQQQLEAYMAWSNNDSVAYQIIFTRLSPTIAAIIPSLANGGFSTAHTLFEYLDNTYGLVQVTLAYDTRSKMRNYRLRNPRDTDTYLLKWSTMVDALVTAGYSVDYCDVILNMVQNLSYTDTTFTVMRVDIQNHINAQRG
ncbi:hypothetical protein BDZ89DRAFT_1145194 [Hymenopellis radicata]|nr:hypothetical protein BDZ89DRAFT_1145194 [Hymenopellis radicata]